MVGLFHNVAHPNHHGDGRLFFRGDEIRQTVQVNAVFTERFPVVGHVHHAAFVFGELFENIDYARGDVVRVQNGVVVRIFDLFLRAGLDFFRIAGGGKFLKFRRIAAVVRRAVAADGVQNDKCVAFDVS